MKRLSPARHAGRWSANQRKRSLSTHREPGRVIHVILRGARGEVEGDARSSGVPVNVVECKKPREQGWRIPAKDSSSPRARFELPTGNSTRVPGSRGGSREKEVISAWKRGSQSLFRREDGVLAFEPGHHGKAPVDVAFGRHSGPALTTKPSKSGRPLETSFARRALRNHHEWWRRACWTVAVSTAHSPPGHAKSKGRKVRGRIESGDSSKFFGCRRASVVC